MSEDAARPEVHEAQLRELVDGGLTVREIAAAIERSVPATRRWLQRFGLRTTRAARRRAVAEGPARRRTDVCAQHGSVVFVRRADGAWQCTRCRSEAVSRRRQKVKEVLVAEAGGACALCGYDRCARALHFHHRDPATKRFALATSGRTRSIAAMREEAAKCVLLCSNCHAEVEAGLASVR